MLSVSKPYNVNDRMINEYGAVGGMRIENEVLWLRPDPEIMGFLSAPGHPGEY
jgi:hypothetical protein